MKKLLLIMAALSVVFSLFSCSPDNREPESDTDIIRTAEERTAETSVGVVFENRKVDEYIDYLSEGTDFAGDTFSVVSNGQGNPEFEEETGIITSDCMYRRQREIEEKFGLDMEYVTGLIDDFSELVISETMAGGDSFDLLCGNLQVAAQPLFLAGCLDYAENFDFIDLSREWWPDLTEEKLAIGDRTYFLTGPIISSFFEKEACVLFNKQTAVNFSIDGLYGLVTAGEWTFDKMCETASVISENDSGSGIYRFDASDNCVGVSFMFASGLTLSERNDGGIPLVPETLSSDYYDIADRISSVISDDTQSVNLKRYSSDPYHENIENKYGVKDTSELFNRGDVLFTFRTTGEVSDMRAVKDLEFGILPYPKYSKEQKEYYSYCNVWGNGAYMLPLTASDREKTGLVCESLAALGEKYLRPAYVDILLKGRSVFDFESRDMLDIIFACPVFDPVDIFGGGDINQVGEMMHLLDDAFSGRKEASLAASYPAVARVYNKLFLRNANRALNKK